MINFRNSVFTFRLQNAYQDFFEHYNRLWCSVFDELLLRRPHKDSEIVKMAGDQTATAAQLAKVKEIYKSWTDNKIFNPKFNIYDLKSADQFADWKFRILVDFNRFELTYLLENDLHETVVNTAEFKKLNQVAVDNIGINLDSELRRCMIPDSTRDKANEIWNRIIAKFEGNGAIQTIRMFTRIQQLLNEPVGDLVQTVATIREVKSRFDEITPKDKDALWKAILNRAIPDHREGLRAILSTLPSDNSHRINSQSNLSTSFIRIYQVSLEFRTNSDTDTFYC